MQLRGKRWWCYWISKIIQYAALGLAALAGASLRATLPDYFPKELHGWLNLVKATAGISVPVLSLISGLFALFSRWAGPPWIWASIQKLLDNFRDEALEMSETSQRHQHRVTLFKHTGFCTRKKSLCCPNLGKLGRRHPWSGWLIPVARSGHTAKKTDTIFLAPDDHENAEGIAGRSWISKETIIVNDLPMLSSDSDDQTVAKYVEMTRTREEWIRERIRKKKECPRSICGIFIEVSGNPWGVIIVDSPDPRGINISKQTWRVYSRILPMMLSELLKKA